MGFKFKILKTVSLSKIKTIKNNELYLHQNFCYCTELTYDILFLLILTYKSLVAIPINPEKPEGSEYLNGFFLLTRDFLDITNFAAMGLFLMKSLDDISFNYQPMLSLIIVFMRVVFHLLFIF